MSWCGRDPGCAFIQAWTRYCTGRREQIEECLQNYHHGLHHIDLARGLAVQGGQQPSGPHLNEAWTSHWWSMGT